MTPPILSVKNLNMQLVIGKHAYNVVENISFDLFHGKTLALVGESGCGKTLTALAVMRIMPMPPALPPQGEILYQGRNLLKLSEKEMRGIRGARIAMIFQDPTSALNPVYTIGFQLLEVIEQHLGIHGDESIEKAIKALTEVGIPNPGDMLSKYPHQLSGGMKQRVMIAMALLCEPDILIADEPTTALDVTIQAQVLDLIRNLQKKRGMALLLITHDMGVVAEMANDVIVMYASQPVEKGNVFQIFDHMSHPYTIGLFQSLPSDTTRRGELKPIKGSVPSLTHYPKGCRFHPRCPFVMEKCKDGHVPDFVIGDSANHLSKCWLYDGSEESENRLQSASKFEADRSIN